MPTASAVYQLLKRRILSTSTSALNTSLFCVVRAEAQEKGVRFGKLQIVDSVHLVADVNIAKDRHRQKEGESPRDKDATILGIKEIQISRCSVSKDNGEWLEGICLRFMGPMPIAPGLKSSGQ